MNQINGLGRRGFLGTVAAVAGGMSLGWNIPAAQAQAANSAATAAGGVEVGVLHLLLLNDITHTEQIE